MDAKFTYLALLGGSILFPFLYSFEKRISFYKRWTSLFISISVVAAFFILWDVWFTADGVWAFNERYVSGLFFINLPVEEWLFFVIIPYACIFIYDAFKYFIKSDPLQPVSSAITFVLSAILIILSFYYSEKQYTQVTFLATAVFLIFHYLVFKNKYLGRFYIVYLIHLIPFFTVNGILTSLPVVTYNNAENLGIRIGTVPVEDSIYSMLLLLMNITIYEFLNQRSFQKRKLSDLNKQVDINPR